MELRKDSDKHLDPQLSTPGTDCTEPMDTDKDALKKQDPGAATTKIKERKSSKIIISNFSQTFTSRSPSFVEQEKENKKEGIQKQDSKKQDFKKSLISKSEMEPESVNVEAKSKKMDVCQTTKPSRPSSTPPSDAGMIVLTWIWGSLLP